MTEAAKLPVVTRVNLNKPPAAEATNAPIITPKFSTVVESVKIDASSADALAPCQYPQLATSKPMTEAILDPHNAKAEVMPQGVPRVMSVNAFKTANTIAAANKGQDPRKIRFQPLSVGSAAILGAFFFFSISKVIQAMNPNSAMETSQAPP